MMGVVTEETTVVHKQQAYREFMINRSRKKAALIAKVSIFLHGIVPLFSLFTDSDPLLVALTSGAVVVSNMILLKATSLTSWFTAHSENCVIVWSICLSALLTFGLSSDMYELDFTSEFYGRLQKDECISAVEAEQRERDVVLSYSLYSFRLSAFPMAIGMMTLYTEALHFRPFVMVLLLRLPAHVYRCLVLHPVPFPTQWAALNYVLFSVIFAMLSWSADKIKLETFRQEQKLNKLNKTLTDRLQAAEKALAFEGPTQEEQRVVGAVLHETGREFKNISIPFEGLEFQERVGAGACGEVIKAGYKKGTVAVKRLVRSRINKTTLRALVAEVRVLRKLRHPNVVKFVGLSWDNVANVCLVLEYLERGSLADVLQDKSIPLSWADPRLKMLMDIAAGAVYLHARPSPIIHRDVKPGNILVTPTFGCKLADFGASRLISRGDLSMTQIGTQSYMAPEMIQSGKYDEKVDIYGIGIMLAVMHTRLPPYYKALDDHNHPSQGGMLLAKVVMGMRPHLPDDMPPMLVALAKECWAGNPEDRPTSTQLLSRLRSLHALVVAEEAMAASSSVRRGSGGSSTSLSVSYDHDVLTRDISGGVGGGGGGGGGAGRRGGSSAGGIIRELGGEGGGNKEGGGG